MRSSCCSQWDKLVALLSPAYHVSDPAVPEPVKGIQAISQYFPMLEQYYNVTHLKGDPAEEPITASFSIHRILAEAAEKAGRLKDDFEVVEITKDRYEKLRQFLS